MRHLIDVPYLDQTDDAPTGCEAVSCVMLLNYLGIETDIKTFFDECMPKGEIEYRDGEMWAPSPNDVFVGDPYTPDAMGCYAPVVEKVLTDLIGDEYEIVNETGTPMETLCTRYIDNGMPVVLWITINLRPYIEGPSWRLTDTGEVFTWRSNEHCLLLVGYDEDHYIFNDPWENRGVIPCEKKLAEQRHAEQHAMAVGIRKKNG